MNDKIVHDIALTLIAVIGCVNTWFSSRTRKRMRRIEPKIDAISTHLNNGNANPFRNKKRVH